MWSRDFNNNERGLSWLLQRELNISRAWASPHFWHKLYTDSRITHWTQIRLPSSLLKQVCPEEGYQWPPCCKIPWQFSALTLGNLSIEFAAVFHHPSWVSWDIFFKTLLARYSTFLFFSPIPLATPSVSFTDFSSVSWLLVGASQDSVLRPPLFPVYTHSPASALVLNTSYMLITSIFLSPGETSSPTVFSYIQLPAWHCHLNV